MNVKSAAKTTLQIIFGRDFGAEVHKLIASAKVISFDVFDTLVIRDCPEPSFVFDVVERRYNNLHSGATLEGFRRARMQAEASARRIAPSGEPTIYEIYALLGNKFEDIAPELLALELDTEYRICRANPIAKDAYDYAIASGKRVVIASDMYLDEATIRAILEKCGYTGFENIYISSEIRQTKRGGGLFFTMRRDMGVNSCDIVHIGDHPLSDWIVPRRIGLRSYLYKRKVVRLHLFDDWASQGWIGDSVTSGILNSTVENGIANYADDARTWMGYAVLGPMLLGYSLWLHGIFTAEKCSDIWFLSREGNLLKRAEERLYGTSNEFKYLNVSRMALCRASANTARDYSELMDIFSGLLSGAKTVGDFLEIAGLESNEDALATGGITPTDLLENVNQENLFNLIMQHGGAFFKSQYELVEEYLHGECDGNSNGRILISDIGWAATMQALLHLLLPEREVIGAYLAVSDFQDGHNKKLDRTVLDRRGYWCNASGWQTDGQMIRFTQSAIETMFLNSEGTTLGYERVDGVVYPQKDETSISHDSSITAKLLQDAAMAFIGDCVDGGTCELVGGIDRISSMLPYLNTVVRPKRKTLELLSHFTFVDGVKRVTFLPEHRLLYYLVHPKVIIRELEINNSKIIWLKGLFKLPLPYYQVLKTLTTGLGMKSNYARTIETVDTSEVEHE